VCSTLCVPIRNSSRPTMPAPATASSRAPLGITRPFLRHTSASSATRPRSSDRTTQALLNTSLPLRFPDRPSLSRPSSVTSLAYSDRSGQESPSRSQLETSTLTTLLSASSSPQRFKRPFHRFVADSSLLRAVTSSEVFTSPASDQFTSIPALPHSAWSQMQLFDSAGSTTAAEAMQQVTRNAMAPASPLSFSAQASDSPPSSSLGSQSPLLSPVMAGSASAPHAVLSTLAPAPIIATETTSPVLSDTGPALATSAPVPMVSPTNSGFLLPPPYLAAIFSPTSASSNTPPRPKRRSIAGSMDGSHSYVYYFMKKIEIFIMCLFPCLFPHP
jgi:hypothetical protein